MKNNVDTYMTIFNAPMFEASAGGDIGQILHNVETDTCISDVHYIFGSSWDLSLRMCGLIDDYFNENNSKYELYGLHLFPGSIYDFNHSNCNYYIGTGFGPPWVNEKYTEFIDTTYWMMSISVSIMLNYVVLTMMYYYFRDTGFYKTSLVIHIISILALFGVSLRNVILVNEFVNKNTLNYVPEILVEENHMIIILLSIVLVLQLLMSFINAFSKSQLLRLYLWIKSRIKGYDEIGFD